MGNLTSERVSTIDSLARRQLRTDIDQYLRTLSKSASDSIFYSQKTHLIEFREWYSDHDNEQEASESVLATQFIQWLCTSPTYSTSTTRDYLNSIANFLAFRYQRDPEIVKLELTKTLGQTESTETEDLTDRIAGELKQQCDEQFTSKIESFLSFLRNRRFGTRTHVYVELILDTKGRPGEVRQLDLKDLDTEHNQLTIGTPDTHVVGAIGLVSDRRIALDSETVAAAEVYLEHERTNVVAGDSSPLFTTSQGQASSSTLCRSVKTASGIPLSNSPATGYPDETTQQDSPDCQWQRIVPREIWQYSRRNVLRNE